MRFDFSSIENEQVNLANFQDGEYRFTVGKALPGVDRKNEPKLSLLLKISLENGNVLDIWHNFSPSQPKYMYEFLKMMEVYEHTKKLGGLVDPAILQGLIGVAKFKKTLGKDGVNRIAVTEFTGKCQSEPVSEVPFDDLEGTPF